MADNKAEAMDTDEQAASKNDIVGNPLAYTRYMGVAAIANKVLAEVVTSCKPGRVISEITAAGNKMIIDQLTAGFPRLKDKGVAFPVSVSVNHCVGHFSPLSSDNTALAEGDLAKIDLGVQLEGYAAVVAHTVMVTANTDASVAITGRQADVICAAHYAGEVAHRLIKAGNTNTQVTEAIGKVAAAFGVNPLEGVLSHQLKQYIIDGNNVILGKSTLEQRVQEFTFEEGQVFGVDIVMSTGEGKAKETSAKTTIFKRAVDQTYSLKLAASKYLFNIISKNTYPFSLANIPEQSKAKMGVIELVNHGLVTPYPVLYEKQGEFVAQIKFVVAIMPNATNRLTGHPLPLVTSERKIEDAELLALLATSTKKKKNKNAAAAVTPTAMDTN